MEAECKKSLVCNSKNIKADIEERLAFLFSIPASNGGAFSLSSYGKNDAKLFHKNIKLFRIDSLV